MGCKKGEHMIIEISTIPKNVEEMRAMKEFYFSSAFQVAALFILAISNYSISPENCYEMIDALKGPVKMNQYEKNFIKDRMRSKADYIGKAYFVGATPSNNYTPSLPYRIVVEENSHSFDTDGFAIVYIKTSGADTPRPVTLRRKGNEWFLWEHAGPLADIRKPASQDPWA
jgi:hypothetical protein